MPGPNRLRKYKNKRGSSCGLCKPWKNGGAPSFKEAVAAEAEAAEDDSCRFPSKPKKSAGPSWRVETFSRCMDKWTVRRYSKESDARRVYGKKKREEASHETVWGVWSRRSSFRLVGPDGSVVESHGPGDVE